jgi:cytochrome c oxidase subunit 2
MQSANAAADHWQMNMYRGVTPLSQDIYDLHMIAIGVCAVIGILVFGVMIYSLVHHRKSKGYVAASFHDNTRVEIIWTIIPFLILVALAVPATQVLMRLEDSRQSDVTIKVVGSQWKWQYQYLDQGISYYSYLATPYAQIQNEQPKGEWYLLEVDKPMVVPVKKKVRFLVTSTDVVHSWWVPELGVKRDAIPGFMHESWAWIEKIGTYRGQCAELCGINHGFMPIVVKAVSQEEFDKWVSEQPKVADPYAPDQSAPTQHKPMTRAALMKLGKTKYDAVCSACHQANGRGIPPLYPALKNSSVAVGYPIDRHTRMILAGIPGSAMQPYKDQLSDKDIAAIVTYERNAWGNNTDDVIQPEDVAKVRLSLHQKPEMVETIPSKKD